MGLARGRGRRMSSIDGHLTNAFPARDRFDRVWSLGVGRDADKVSGNRPPSNGSPECGGTTGRGDDKDVSCWACSIFWGRTGLIMSGSPDARDPSTSVGMTGVGIGMSGVGIGVPCAGIRTTCVGVRRTWVVIGIRTTSWSNPVNLSGTAPNRWGRARLEKNVTNSL